MNEIPGSSGIGANHRAATSKAFDKHYTKSFILTSQHKCMAFIDFGFDFIAPEFSCEMDFTFQTEEFYILPQRFIHCSITTYGKMNIKSFIEKNFYGIDNQPDIFSG